MLVYFSFLYEYPKLWLWGYKNICYSLSPVGTNQTKSIQWGLAILPFLYEWRWCPAVGGSCRIVSTVQQDYDANGFLEIVYSSNIFYFPCQIPLFFYLFNLSFNNFENSTQILWTVRHCSQTKNPSPWEIKQILRYIKICFCYSNNSV